MESSSKGLELEAGRMRLKFFCLSLRRCKYSRQNQKLFENYFWKTATMKIFSCIILFWENRIGRDAN